MIAMLRGRVLHLGETDCLIDVGGVGYQCQMTRRCLAKLGSVGTEATIYVDTTVQISGRASAIGNVARAGSDLGGNR